GSRDNSAKIWDMPATFNVGAPFVIKKPRLELKGHTNAVEAIAISPDGTTVATGSWDNTVRTWNAADGKLLTTFSGFPSGLASVVFHKDGRELAAASDSGGQGGQVRRFELATGKQLGQHGHQQAARCITYTPDGEQLLSLGEERAISRVAIKDHKSMGQ